MMTSPVTAMPQLAVVLPSSALKNQRNSLVAQPRSTLTSFAPMRHICGFLHPMRLELVAYQVHLVRITSPPNPYPGLEGRMGAKNFGRNGRRGERNGLATMSGSQLRGCLDTGHWRMEGRARQVIRVARIRWHPTSLKYRLVQPPQSISN